MNAAATAASTALPPCSSTHTPACVASTDPVDTMPKSERASFADNGTAAAAVPVAVPSAAEQPDQE